MSRKSDNRRKIFVSRHFLDKHELTSQRTRLNHQVRTQLWRYFPRFLNLKLPLSSAVFAVLRTLIPTPTRARCVRRASVEKILKQYRIRRSDAKHVLTILRTTPAPIVDGILEATTTNIRLRLRQLALIEEQLQ